MQWRGWNSGLQACEASALLAEIVLFYMDACRLHLLLGCNTSSSPFSFIFLLPVAAISPLTPNEWHQPRVLSSFPPYSQNYFYGFERSFSGFGFGGFLAFTKVKHRTHLNTCSHALPSSLNNASWNALQVNWFPFNLFFLMGG